MKGRHAAPRHSIPWEESHDPCHERRVTDTEISLFLPARRPPGRTWRLPDFWRRVWATDRGAVRRAGSPVRHARIVVTATLPPLPAPPIGPPRITGAVAARSAGSSIRPCAQVRTILDHDTIDEAVDSITMHKIEP
jgi:hypothetical protein